MNEARATTISHLGRSSGYRIDYDQAGQSIGNRVRAWLNSHINHEYMVPLFADKRSAEISAASGPAALSSAEQIPWSFVLKAAGARHGRRKLFKLPRLLRGETYRNPKRGPRNKSLELSP